MVQLECLESAAGCDYKTQDLDFEAAEKILDKHMERAHPVGGQEEAAAAPAPSQPIQLSCSDCEFQTQEVPSNEEANSLLGMHRKRNHPSRGGGGAPPRGSRNKENEGPGYIKMSGMVWSANEDDITAFLLDCNVKEVILLKTETGRPAGDAVVELATLADVERAKKHNRKYIRERFVAIDQINADTFQKLSQPYR